MTTPAVSRRGFLPDEWDSLRDSGIRPLNESELSSDEAMRAEFIRGGELLRLHGDRSTLDPFTGKPKTLQPQQLRFADVMNAGSRFSSALFPRRSSKTSSFFALAVGRCDSREGYLASYTMLTTAIKSRERFRRDLALPLEQLYPDKKSRPFKISYAGGYERVEWDNGSMFAFLAPRGESFRSDAWDLIGLDEAGEADVETTKDVLAGVLATGDTRPGSQVVIEGTAAEFRTGNMLWDELELGRQGLEDHAILEYAGRPGLERKDFDTWEKMAPLLVAHHPGIGTLTRLPMLRGNFDKMDPEDFAREYLSIFGTGGTLGGVLNMRQFAAGALSTPKPEQPPGKFAIGIAAHRYAPVASIVAAWREDDVPHLLVLDHVAITSLVKRTKELATRYRAPVAHDTTGPITVEAEALGRERPSVSLRPQSFPKVKTAAALLVKEVEQGRVKHWDQAVLNEAVRVAKKRTDSRYSGFAFGFAEDEDDITPVEAGSMALRLYDEIQNRPAIKPFAA